MDSARGLAVLGMIVMHFIPTEGAITPVGLVATHFARLLSGKPAALFFVLAGMAWALQQERSGWTRAYRIYVWRRATALVLVGALLHAVIWPTEVLMALGCSFPIVTLLFSRGKRALWISLTLVLAMTPILAWKLSSLVSGDWSDNGEPILTLSSSLRLIFFDGSYPLFPWVAFVVAGMLTIQVSKGRAQWALACLGMSLFVWSAVHFIKPSTGSLFSIEWVPTSLPFVVVCGGIALAVVFGVSAFEPQLSRWRIYRGLSNVGRMSLTHYLGHILLIVLPLRHWYPGEEWPTRVGVGALVVYTAFAFVASSWWFEKHNRGPVEALLGWVSGSPRTQNAR